MRTTPPSSVVKCALHLSLLLSSSSLASANSYSANSYSPPCPNPNELTRDVVVVGGGAGGTHAAVRLQQMGYTVALVEKTGRLGGHVNTVVTPGTNKTFDLGVIFFENTNHTLDYAATLGIELAPASLAGGPGTSFANFHTDGKILPSLPPSVPFSNLTAVGLALGGWLQQLERFPFLSEGYDLPDPVPEDLLLPCGDFLEKHGLGAAANFLDTVAQGVGNVLAQPTLYIMKYVNTNVTLAALGLGAPLLTTADMDNQGLYDSALRKLGGDVVFLNSTVTKVQRGDAKDQVLVSIKTPGGQRIVRARKLLVAIPPLVSNLKGMGLQLMPQEEVVFGRLNNSFYWDMVIRNPGIPQNVSLMPIDLSAPLAIPSTPILLATSAAPIGVPDLFGGYFTSPHPLSDQAVQTQVLDTFAKISAANHFPPSPGKPEFVEFHAHNPFLLTFPAEDIRQGMYGRMNALQGLAGTFYTGAAWQAENSAEIWGFNDNILLPQVVKALKA